MLYTLQQGPYEKKILERAFAQRLPIPKTIQNAPELLPGLAMYYGAFQDLLSCRQVGFDSGPISWLVVDEYADRCGYSQDQKDDLHYYVKELDEAYLEFNKAKRESTSSVPKK